MASITFSAEQAVLDRYVMAACVTYRYSATMPDGTPNPQSPGQFAADMVVRFCREVTAGYEAGVAAESARQAALAAATADLSVPVTVTINE